MPEEPRGEVDCEASDIIPAPLHLANMNGRTDR
jgi:hypothetical protein